jgi:hypothetical protein
MRGAIERHSQFCTNDGRLAEHLGRILDAAHQIDRGPDYGEIEPVGSADIAVMDRADMQRDDNVQRGLVVHLGVARKTGDRGDRVTGRGNGGLCDRSHRVGLGDRKNREKTVPDEFENFAAMPADFRGLRLEQRIEDRDHPLAGQPVGALCKTAQVGRPQHRG